MINLSELRSAINGVLSEDFSDIDATTRNAIEEALIDKLSLDFDVFDDEEEFDDEDEESADGEDYDSDESYDD